MVMKLHIEVSVSISKWTSSCWKCNHFHAFTTSYMTFCPFKIVVYFWWRFVLLRSIWSTENQLLEFISIVRKVTRGVLYFIFCSWRPVIRSNFFRKILLLFCDVKYVMVHFFNCWIFYFSIPKDSILIIRIISHDFLKAVCWGIENIHFHT